MDKIDEKILDELIDNSRTPATVLAKRLRISREVASYRISRLVKEGVIKEFTTEIENSDFIGAAVFLNIKASHEEEFKDYVNRLDFVSWVSNLSGVWNFGLSIYGRDNSELNSRFLEIYDRFRNQIIGHRFTLHKKTTFFYSKYFKNTSNNSKSLRPKSLDAIDKRILAMLSRNSRTNALDIAHKVGLTGAGIAKRIRFLEKSNILRYSVSVDISKLGLYQYSVFIKNDITSRKKLVPYLSLHPRVSFVAEYIGEEFLEFGVFVNDPYELRSVLQGIEQDFPENRVFEVSMFQKDVVSIGPPNCWFK